MDNLGSYFSLVGIHYGLLAQFEQMFEANLVRFRGQPGTEFGINLGDGMSGLHGFDHVQPQHGLTQPVAQRIGQGAQSRGVECRGLRRRRVRGVLDIAVFQPEVLA